MISQGIAVPRVINYRLFLGMSKWHFFVNLYVMSEAYFLCDLEIHENLSPFNCKKKLNPFCGFLYTKVLIISNTFQYTHSTFKL